MVVPLAAVVSASMPMHAIFGTWRGEQRVFTPINGGSRPAPRLGLRLEAVLEHIRWLNTRFLDVLQNALAEGIALVPLAVAGLARSDNCHGRTVCATEVLITELRDRTPDGIIDGEAIEFMNASPSLFLNLWMTATKCMMKLAEGVEGSSLVTTAGGNGRDLGIQISGLPGRWFTLPADAPKGNFDVDLPAERAMGAVGDSAVVEAYALGGMAMELSPIQRKGLGEFLPADSGIRTENLSVGTHP